MPRNGAGTYSAPPSTWNPGVNGVLATTADYNAQLTDISAAITQSVSRDGQSPMTGNLPMGNNKITGLANGAANTDAATIGNLNSIAGQAGGVGDRNLLINGNFAINQRVYASGVATTGANQYTLDRWRVVTSGQNITFGAAAPDRTVTCPAGGLEQVIEGGMVVGGVYTLSWTGTATATVNGVAIVSGGNTAVLPANTNVTVKFSSGTVVNAQFELGTSATPYQRRQLSVELILCQRYYQTSYDGSAPGAPAATGNRMVSLGFGATTPGVQFQVKLQVRMRTIPTITIYNPTTGATGSIRNESAGSDLAVITFGTPGVDFFAVLNNAAAAAVGLTYGMHFTASAEL